MSAAQSFHDEQGDDAQGGEGPGPGSGGQALTPAQRCAWEAVSQGGWRVLAKVNQGLADGGFTSTPDLRVLDVLGRAPRMRISDIASSTHIQMSTVSRQIGRLVDQGLVERIDEVDGDDARHRWVRATATGRERLRRLVACRDAAVYEHVVSVLGEEDFLVLGSLFQRLTGEGGTWPEGLTSPEAH